MDFVDLFERKSLVGKGISVVVRPADVEANSTGRSFQTAVDAVISLLGERASGAEIIFLVESFPSAPPPTRINGTRIRFVVVVNSESGMALTTGIRAARNPVLLFVDDEVSLNRDELKGLLERLEYADIVSGRRRKRWSSASLCWPIDRLLRSVLGVPFTDPFCPIKIARREALAEVHLDQNGPRADFELLAKATYLIRLVDEVRIALPWQGPTITGALFGQWRSFIAMILRPRFADPAESLAPTVQAPFTPTMNWTLSPVRRPNWCPVPRRNWQTTHRLFSR